MNRPDVIRRRRTVMAEKNPRRNETIDALFDAILSLETREECYDFFEDLCTVKEISDMAQRLEAAKLLLDGSTYEQIVKTVEISTATISRINRCIQYGTGGYRQTIEKVREKQQ
jgi:TrpR-related protein YerC/YecD